MRFNDKAAYLTEATGFEKIQLNAMAEIIEVKAKELRLLREVRHTLANRVASRAAMKDWRKETPGPPPIHARIR